MFNSDQKMDTLPTVANLNRIDPSADIRRLYQVVAL